MFPYLGVRRDPMYGGTMKNQQPTHLCDYCRDPARIINTIKKPYWPFAVDRTDAYCYECYQEVVKGQIPKVTDSTLPSRRGRGIKKRRRLMED